MNHRIDLVLNLLMRSREGPEIGDTRNVESLAGDARSCWSRAFEEFFDRLQNVN